VSLLRAKKKELTKLCQEVGSSSPGRRVPPAPPQAAARGVGGRCGVGQIRVGDELDVFIYLGFGLSLMGLMWADGGDWLRT
jgi:hypothetical protein